MVQVFFDTETTGVETGACVVELAAIMVEDGVEIDSFHEYARPYRKMNPNASKVTGITDEFLSQFPEEKIMLQNFMAGMMGVEVDECLAYNAHFDVRIINDRINMDSLSEDKFFNNYKVTDVAKTAKSLQAIGKLKKDGHKGNLTYVANQLGYYFTAHNALEDTRAMIEVYNRLQKL